MQFCLHGERDERSGVALAFRLDSFWEEAYQRRRLFIMESGAAVPREGTDMAQRDDRKRLGKKHRQASTRPKKGRAPKSTPTTGATGKLDPRKRKIVATKKAKEVEKKLISRRSP